jgi:outer membrane protein TolC
MIEHMEHELHQELSYFLAKFTANMAELLEMQASSEEAEAKVTETFNLELNRYNLGAGASFQDVIDARLGMQRARLGRLEADREVNLARISLARAMSEGLFEIIDPPK